LANRGTAALRLRLQRLRGRSPRCLPCYMAAGAAARRLPPPSCCWSGTTLRIEPAPRLSRTHAQRAGSQRAGSQPPPGPPHLPPLPPPPHLSLGDQRDPAGAAAAQGAGPGALRGHHRPAPQRLQVRAGQGATRWAGPGVGGRRVRSGAAGPPLPGVCGGAPSQPCRFLQLRRTTPALAAAVLPQPQQPLWASRRHHPRLLPKAATGRPLRRSAPPTKPTPCCRILLRAAGAVDVVLSYCHYSLNDSSLRDLLPYLQVPPPASARLLPCRPWRGGP
jgi:hypothetical protein